MLERHRTQNEVWLEKTRGEIDDEKKELAEQKVGQCSLSSGDRRVMLGI